MKPLLVTFCPMSRRACALLLFALLLLLLPARIEIQDEEIFLNTAVNLLETGLPVYTAQGITLYQRYSPVYATLLAGHLALVRPVGELLARWFPAHGNLLNWGLVLSFNVFVAVLLYLLMARSLGGPPALWLVALLSSFTLFYATTLFMDLLLALLLLFTAVLASRGRWIAAALALALLGMMKVTNLVYLPALVLLVAAAPGRLARPSATRTLAALALAVGIPAAFHLAFNFFVRGNATDFGYAPVYIDPLSGQWIAQGFNHSPLRGLAGFLFSPGKSLFLYAPLTVLGTWGLVRGWRAGDPLSRIAAVLAATTLALYAGWSQWEGGICFGPRLLLPVVPLALCGLTRIELPRNRSLVIVLAAVGLLINVTARLAPIFPAYLASGAYGTGDSYSLAHNFLADQFGAFARLPQALAAQPPVNLAPALLAATGPNPSLLQPLLWLGTVLCLAVLALWALAAQTSQRRA